MSRDPRPVVVDTDTATDDALAILLAATSERIDLRGLTVVAGNVDFDQQVANAKHVLDLAGVADEVPVHEGAREPLERDYESAADVHGPSGLGDLSPDPDLPSADEGAVDYVVRTARENPGEVTLVAIGPLTNVALALERDPDLPDLLDEVWVMGGARNTLGNVTPAAEFNFWVDPDAARRVVREMPLTLVDWGLAVRDGVVSAATLDAAADAGTDFGSFAVDATRTVRAVTRDREAVDGVVAPDVVPVALLVDPEVCLETATYFVDVDDREGMTRGYSLVDERGVTDEPARTAVVLDVDGERFDAMVRRTLLDGSPDA